MKGLLADNNVGGQLRRLVLILERSEFAPFWKELKLTVDTVTGIGLDQKTSDTVIWKLCQEMRWLLVTANRNHDGADSLNSAIQGGSPMDLPVFTLSDSERVMTEAAYAERVAFDLLEGLLKLRDEPESLLGSGRIYLPQSAS